MATSADAARAQTRPSHPKILLSRFLVPAMGLLALAAFVLLYLRVPDTYERLMRVVIRYPQPIPFGDWEFMPSAIRCWSEGVNVYVNNPCFRLSPEYQFNYPPIWLRATFLRSGEAWSAWFGLSLAVLLLASLATLPPPRSLRDQVVAVLATLSSATILGLERANLDLLMFLLVLLAVNLQRPSLLFRLGGYLLLIGAGLLKLYPFAALCLALKERAVVLVAVAFTAVAALAGLVIHYRQEFAWMAHNLPQPSVYTLQFGAAGFPAGLGTTIAKIISRINGFEPEQSRALADFLARLIAPALMIASAGIGGILARHYRLAVLLKGLKAREGAFLIAGASIMCACFFLGPNVIYRGIFLLLILPGLAGLRDLVPASFLRRLFDAAGLAVPFVLWAPCFQQLLINSGLSENFYYQQDPWYAFPRRPVPYLYWWAEQLSWWTVITLLLALLMAFVFDAARNWLKLARKPAAEAR